MIQHTIYKNIAVGSVMAGLLIGYTPSAWAHSDVSRDRFCEEISQMQSRTTQWSENYGDAKEDHHGEKMIRRQHAWSERDAEKAERRSDKETRQGKKHNKLESRATTSVQKQAVATFEASVKAAISVRQAEIDKAITDFRVGVASSSSAYQVSIDAAIAEFKNEVNVAFAKAKTDCASGKDVAVIQAELKAALKASKDDMKLDVKAVAVSPRLEALREVRKNAIEKALVKFKSAFTAAKVTLEAALK